MDPKPCLSSQILMICPPLLFPENNDDYHLEAPADKRFRGHCVSEGCFIHKWQKT